MGIDPHHQTKRQFSLFHFQNQVWPRSDKVLCGLSTDSWMCHYSQIKVQYKTSSSNNKLIHYKIPKSFVVEWIMEDISEYDLQREEVHATCHIIILFLVKYLGFPKFFFHISCSVYLISGKLKIRAFHTRITSYPLISLGQWDPFTF